MAHVNHNHIHEGHSYLYEHYRDGDQVKSVYLGSADNVRTVSSIPAKGYPVEAECYKEGHQAGIDAEKRVYGEERYKELNEHIKEVVPEGELAGSHTEEGEILIHKNIDEKYHKQVILHEKTEHEYMTAKACKAPSNSFTEDSKHYPVGAGRYYEVKNVGAKPRNENLTLAQKRKIEYVMREYHAGRLKSSSGEKVADEKQAAAIAYSQARKTS